MRQKFTSKLFLWALAGAAASCLTVVVSAFTIYPELQWVLPQHIWSACAFFGGPGLITGVLIKRFSRYRFSTIAGFIGIILGVLWHLHLAGLSAQIANAYYDSAEQILSSVLRRDGFFLSRWIVNAEYRVLLFEGTRGFAAGLVILLSPVLAASFCVYTVNSIVRKSKMSKWERQIWEKCRHTRRYLLKELTEQEFYLLDRCMERFDYTYKNLFFFCEDLSVHNQMQLCADYMGISSAEHVFTEEERRVILSAESSLNSAPDEVEEELRVFCHF